MRILETDMGERKMDKKNQQDRMGKPSGAFYRAEGHLTIQLLPQKGNEELLAEVPHILWLDLAVVFRYYWEEERYCCSMLIQWEYLADWNVTVEQVWRKARENMPRLFPVKLCSVEEAMRDMREGMEVKSQKIRDRKRETGLSVQLYLLTNQRGYNGATAIFYEGVLKEFAERVGKDLIILPSSIHEVLLIPDDGTSSYEMLSALVREVNRSEVPRRDQLSDHIYRYLREKDCLEIA